jgi:hypothetical protein
MHMLCESTTLRGDDRFWPILLQKSPRRNCRIRIRNNRIGTNEFLNQRCLLAPDLESILLARMSKILLQQNRPFASFAAMQHVGRFRSEADIGCPEDQSNNAPEVVNSTSHGAVTGRRSRDQYARGCARASWGIT